MPRLPSTPAVPSRSSSAATLPAMKMLMLDLESMKSGDLDGISRDAGADTTNNSLMNGFNHSELLRNSKLRDC